MSDGSESTGGKNVFSNTNNKCLEVFENKFVPFKRFFFWGGGELGVI